MRSLAIVALTAVLPLIYSCATVPKPTAMRKDPLIGKIVRGADKDAISFSTLVKELGRQDVIYLSEKHDNPMHHAIQRRIITELADSGRIPALGFEFFAVHHTPLLLSLMDSKKAGHPPGTQKEVERQMRKKLGWDDQSDTMWSYYWDLLVLARDRGLSAAGLDLDSAQKRRITRKGLDGLTPLEKKELFSTQLMNPAYKDHMTATFKAVHCGMNHGRMADRLYDTWQARNDRMALSIVRLQAALEPGQGPVVIIMGNGHTEYGLGVMDRVRHLNPDISQANLAMTEIFRKPAELDAYLIPLDLKGHPPAPPADYLWFTQRVSYEDPCEKFKEALKKMKGKGLQSKENPYSMNE